jgi:hypothetical protein
VRFELDFCGAVVMSCCCEKLEAENGDRLRTRRNGNVCRWKPLPSNGSEEVTVEIVCNSEL